MPASVSAKPRRPSAPRGLVRESLLVDQGADRRSRDPALLAEGDGDPAGG